MDRFLARNGYDSQQYDGLEDVNRPNNRLEPVPGDHGAHGAFDDRAQAHSLELWAETNWITVMAAAAGVVAALFGTIHASRQRMPTRRKAA